MGARSTNRLVTTRVLRTCRYGNVNIILGHFSALLPPPPNRVPYSTWCPCFFDTEWCLQSVPDAVPNSRLQAHHERQIIQLTEMHCDVMEMNDHLQVCLVGSDLAGQTGRAPGPALKQNPRGLPAVVALGHPHVEAVGLPLDAELLPPTVRGTVQFPGSPPLPTGCRPPREGGWG